MFASVVQEREMNQVVLSNDFMFSLDEASLKYRAMEEHEMRDEIALCRRIAGRVLGIRMKVFERVNTIQKKNGTDIDIDTSQPFMAGLQTSSRLPDMKVMGALLNPLYQNDLRMIDAGLLTLEQYSAGKEELIHRMSRFHSMQTKFLNLADADSANTNKWDKGAAGVVLGIKSPRKKAEEEYDAYLENMHSVFLPKMEPQQVLGWINNDGDPISHPVFSIGKVINPGRNLPSTKNHAQYIDESGHYDLVSYLSDHKGLFPAIYHVGIGQISPHVSTEVDCESLFSQAGALANSRRARTNVRYYERLVIIKHRLHRIYCHAPAVRELYIKREKADNWDEAADRDALEYLDIEEEIFMKQHPLYADKYKDDASEDSGDDEVIDMNFEQDSSNTITTSKPAARMEDE
jgi:hypothetical protein